MVRNKNKNNIPEIYQSPTQYFCDKFLGPVGKMISNTKSSYVSENPNNLIIFNAILVSKEGVSLWHGDLDITKSHHDLISLQEKIDTFYIFEKNDFSKDKFNLAQASYNYSNSGFKCLKLKSLEEGRDGEPKIAKCLLSIVSDFEEKQELFEKIKIPDIKSINNPTNESGWLLFQKELISMYGKEYSLKIYKDLYISKRDNDRIDLISKKAILKTHSYLNSSKINKSVAIDNLAHSCRDFHVDPSWVEYGYGYLPKDLK